MKNCICKIKKINNTEIESGNGFFCCVINKDKKFFFLITNNYIINEEIIELNSIITIILNSPKEERNIDIKNNRKIFIKYDVVLIEINPEKDKIINFLELDEYIFNVEENEEFKDIYIIQYLKGENEEKMEISYGTIKQLNNYNIIYYCYTEEGSLGSPIINLENNKVIGIHYESSSYYNHNKGIFLKFPLYEYVNKKNLFEYTIKNEINIMVLIKKQDINKNIYFLNSKVQQKEKGINNYHKILKDLNKSNVELYINKIKN